MTDSNAKSSETDSNELQLEPLQAHHLDLAWIELKKAEESIGRAAEQEHLREALGAYTRGRPQGYTDEEFEAKYNRLYNISYRGYA